jgi:hypothetical protein
LTNDLILSVDRDPISGGWRATADDGSVCETGFATCAAAQRWVADRAEGGPSPRSEAVMEAIRRAIDAAGLAYSFGAGSDTMASLNAAMAVERVYLGETTAPQAAAEGAAGRDFGRDGDRGRCGPS